MPRNLRRKKDKFIDGVPHSECLSCFKFKPVSDFYVKTKRRVFSSGPIEESEGQSVVRKVKMSYCKDCQNKNMRNTFR